MAFNLQLVLKALLFSSSQPLSIKDIQAAFTRFHDQAQALALKQQEASKEGEPEAESAATAEKRDLPEPPAASPHEGEAVAAGVEAGVAPATGEEDAAAEPTDADLYAEVPSLVTAAQIREAMDAIAGELRAANDVYLLIEGAQGYRLVTHPRFARWVRILRNEPPPAKLSQSALETLAVIAYRQPVTRTEIETIRGVSAEAGLNKLLERELVYITGRADLPGRPLQYGTTDKFLEFVGVKSLVELPASDVLSPRQIDEWLKNAMNPTTPGDAEMGLPLEAGEGETPMEDEAHLELAPEREASPPERIEPPAPVEEGEAPRST
jgi:segregation and condensation protein B